mgnify:CR=1 FL=1
MKDGMIYAPKGKPAPVVERGEFRFAAARKHGQQLPITPQAELRPGFRLGWKGERAVEQRVSNERGINAVFPQQRFFKWQNTRGFRHHFGEFRQTARA